MQVILVMFKGEGERRSFSIVRDVTVIGRREDCDFRIPLGEISRKHCRLIKDGDALRAEDLGSSNGTYVNGIRIHETELTPGDTLKVGSVVFVVQINGVPAEDELVPVPSSASDSAAAAAQHDELLDPTAQSEVNHDSSVEVTSTGGLDDIDELLVDDSPADHGTGEHGTGEHESGEHRVSEHEAAGHEAVDEIGAHESAEPAAAAGEYDPMDILDADPDASSVGSMMHDDDQIADDLIVELESQDQHKSNQ